MGKNGRFSAAYRLTLVLRWALTGTTTLVRPILMFLSPVRHDVMIHKGLKSQKTIADSLDCGLVLFSCRFSTRKFKKERKKEIRKPFVCWCDKQTANHTKLPTSSNNDNDHLTSDYCDNNTRQFSWCVCSGAGWTVYGNVTKATTTNCGKHATLRLLHIF